MPDIVSQVYANTLAYSNFDSNGEVTVLSTDGATRYVLKDIAVETGFTGTSSPKLLVNGHNVATLGSNVSGSEIIDINSTVKIALGASKARDLGTFKLGYVNGTYSSSSFLEATTPTIISANATAVAPTMAPVSSPGAGLSNSQNNYGLVYANNSIGWSGYSDGNSTSYLYRNGSNIISPSYARFAYDGIGNYYYLGQDAYIRKYNISTQSDSAVLYVGYSGSTYPTAGFSNGIFFHVRNYGSGVINIFNTATNALYSVSVNTGTFSSETNCYVTYDPVNYIYYYWVKGNGFSTTAKYVRIQSNAANNSFVLMDGTEPVSTTFSESYYWGYCNYSPAIGYAVVSDVTNKLHLLDYAMRKVIVLSTSPNQIFSTVTRFPSETSSTIPDSLMPTFKVRITGVKST